MCATFIDVFSVISHNILTFVHIYDFIYIHILLYESQDLSI